jgi:hypothetical protein
LLLGETLLLDLEREKRNNFDPYSQSNRTENFWANFSKPTDNNPYACAYMDITTMINGLA